MDCATDLTGIVRGISARQLTKCINSNAENRKQGTASNPDTGTSLNTNGAEVSIYLRL